MGVIEFLCDLRFHKSFTLPPNPTTGRTKPYRVSYSDYGDTNSDAVVLLCGALMGMRFSYSPMDQLARAYKVRIIHPDRPGIGGSDPVELHERIPMWLEIVPQLLAHLKVSHVSLVSHSGGDIYLLNTLLTYPHLLHPLSPYVCFFAPWVHQSHTKMTQLRATELLPAPLIGKFASLLRFVNDNVMPLAGLSGSVLQGLKASLYQSSPQPAPVALTPVMPSARSRTSSITSREGDGGFSLDDPEAVEELRKLAPTYLFAESIDGVSADAQIFLKKPHSISWCAGNLPWSDVDDAVPLFSKIIEEQDAGNGQRKWLIDVFHAEEDNMVGEKGRHWFDKCWTPAELPLAGGIDTTNQTTEENRRPYEYRSEVVEGTEHNYLMDPAFGVSEVWLQRVRAAFPVVEQV